MDRDVLAHMSEDYRWREMERRLDKVEKAAELVPVIQRDIAEVKGDIAEVKDDTRSLRRALYTTALSIVGSAVVFAVTVQQIFK